MIQTLNEKFINTWVTLRELSELIEGAKGERVSLFARSIKDYYVYPVDIQVLNLEAELIMHQPDSKLPHDNRTQKYLTLLADAVKGEVANLSNGNEEKSATESDLNSRNELMKVLNVFRGPGDGYQDYTVVEIDTTRFEQEGILVIDIQVGEGEAMGSFDLFAGDAELPTEGFPDDALASAWDIPPGDTGQICHQFTRGQRFKLGATGNWFCEKGSTNAFLARISVVPSETSEAD